MLISIEDALLHKMCITGGMGEVFHHQVCVPYKAHPACELYQ